jgi:alpha-ketoglutarate-dependent 2,4-dichlorophenoxyacetate dioxygenase
MAIRLTPLKAGFAAEIVGIDAARASESDIAAVKSALLDHAVVVLRDQHLSEEEQAGFGARFGPLDTNPLAAKRYNKGMREDLLGVSNADKDFKPFEATDARRLLDMGNKFWHTDSSYKEVTAHLSMLYGIRVTEDGGQTQFADMKTAYDTLAPDMKRLVEGLVAEHSGVHARVQLGFNDWSEEQLANLGRTVGHDLVRTLPESGRRSLYLSSHAAQIAGLPTPVGRMLLHELTEHATTPDKVYSHTWRTNDLVIWDNRCTMHRMRRYKASAEARVLRRVTTLDPTFPARDPATVSVPDWLLNEAA